MPKGYLRVRENVFFVEYFVIAFEMSHYLIHETSLEKAKALMSDVPKDYFIDVEYQVVDGLAQLI